MTMSPYRPRRPLGTPRAAALGIGLIVCGLGGTSALAEPPPRARACDRLAAASGNDSWSGRPDRPFKTAQRLVDSLAPGEVGCLAGGQTFGGGLTISHGGRPGRRVTLRSGPGQTATLAGRLWVSASANHVSIIGLHLDGRNSRRLPSPTINGDNVSFVRNDVTNHRTAICFLIGSVAGWGVASNTRIVGNVVHDCGRYPPTNHQHGVYVEAARNTLIADNIITRNADRGIQLYPDAQDTLITRNLIDRNGVGVIISGDAKHQSRGTLLVNNIISNSLVRHNVEAYWETSAPSNGSNTVGANCLWNGAEGNFGERVGFRIAGTIVESNPRVVWREGKPILGRRTPCRPYWPRMSPRDAQTVLP